MGIFGNKNQSQQAFNDNQYREQVDALQYIDDPAKVEALAANASPEGRRAAAERLQQLGQ